MTAVSSCSSGPMASSAPLVNRAVRSRHQASSRPRGVVDAMLYIAQTGCQWRYLPGSFGPWPGSGRSSDAGGRVTWVWELAERRLAEGDASFLADLGIALTERYGFEPAPVWQYRSVFDRLLRLLVTRPSRENVEQALRLAAVGSDRKRARYVASLLAAGQAPQDLSVVFSGGSSRAGASEELRACLVHELVLRGVSAEETPGIAGWASSPHWNYHPIGWLPLSLTALEGQPTLPSYSIGGASYDLPYGPSDGQRMRPDSGAPVPAATETTTDSTASAIAAAVANWADESNGRIEARVYELAEDVEADAVAGTLLTLGLEPLRGLGPAAVSHSPPASRLRPGRRCSRRPRQAGRTTAASTEPTGGWPCGGRSPRWQAPRRRIAC